MTSPSTQKPVALVAEDSFLILEHVRAELEGAFPDVRFLFAGTRTGVSTALNKLAAEEKRLPNFVIADLGGWLAKTTFETIDNLMESFPDLRLPEPPHFFIFAFLQDILMTLRNLT